MLTISLRRTQIELQAHRSWLNAFLARTQPSNLGYPSRHAISRPSPHAPPSRQYAEITPKHIRKRLIRERRAIEIAARQDAEQTELLELLRRAIQDVDIKSVIKLFDHITDYSLLDRSAASSLAQCLHEALRRVKRTDVNNRPIQIGDLIDFAEKLVKLIKQGDLEPDRRAHLHLLCVFKESGVRDAGVVFWQWLEKQDDRYVGDDVYGAAIDLLATNGAPLAEMEELYERALQRFPGVFNAYHMSPNAIVADRDHGTNIKGISMVLLQGILTARLLRGDSRNAYMALDTALRLYPVLTPRRFLTLFIDERPTTEAYTAFAIACRAGNAPPVEGARKLLTALRMSSDLSSPNQHVTVLRQMISLAYLYIGSGGVITNNLVSDLTIAMTQILRLKGTAALESKQKKQIVAGVMDAIRKTLEIFARYGAKPTLSAFNSIIVNLAGFGQSKQLIGVALKDLQQLGLQPNHITRRSTLTAAGKLGDADLVARSWADLVMSKSQKNQLPDTTDFHILVKAAKLSGAIQFAEEECKYLPEHVRQSLLERLYGPVEKEVGDSSAVLDVPGLLCSMDALHRDLGVIDEQTKDRPVVQDFSTQNIPILATPPCDQIYLPEEELQKLYDEVMMEQPRQNERATPDQHPPVPPETSPTNIPYGTLRYENWKTINHLLALAEKHDNAYSTAVDEAIAKGVAPPSREQALKLVEDGERDWRGLSDSGAGDAVTVKGVDAETIGRARKEILRLRGLRVLTEGQGR